MLRIFPFLFLCAAAAAAAGPQFGGPSLGGTPTPERIAAALAASESVDGPAAVSGKSLREFYLQRGYEPAWIRFGLPGKQARQVYAAVRDSRMDGLTPEDYHVSALDSLLRQFHRKIFLGEQPAPGAALELELLLTDAFLRLGDDLLTGRWKLGGKSDPWRDRSEGIDLPRYLQASLTAGADMRSALAALAPRDPEYALLKGFLTSYRKIRASGGWPSVPGNGSIGSGDSGPRVDALCRRLQAEGDMPKGACPDSFDVRMASAVRIFQARHGLDTTAKVRKPDLEQLNAGVDRRIAQIAANLEYRRWLPRDLGPRHVRVNLAAFRLFAMDSGATSLDMKIVIGRRQDRTPVFHDRILAVELNPPWNVPDDIAKEEILPELRKDPDYLGKHQMELLSGRAEGTDTLSPRTIDWRSLADSDFRFRIRQKPGPASALGKIKFVLSNPFNIYLHDTPAISLFARPERAFSHGCVRLENPFELAAWALGDHGPWTREALAKAIAKGRTESIRLPGEGIPIFILYWTAFVDADGKLNFRKDIYGREEGLEGRLTGSQSRRSQDRLAGPLRGNGSQPPESRHFEWNENCIPASRGGERRQARRNRDEKVMVDRSLAVLGTLGDLGP